MTNDWSAPPTAPFGIVHILTDEQITEFEARFAEAWHNPGPPIILPPGAVEIHRCYTPEQRRAYLIEHHGEVLAYGIPEALVDLLIEEGEQDGAE